MLTYSILAVVVLAAVVAIVIAVKGSKKVTVESIESKAVKEANKLSAAEKEEMVGKFANKSVDWIHPANDKIIAKIHDLSVVSVSVHGIKYNSVVDAVKRSSSLSESEALKMMTMDKELGILRQQKFAAERHYTVTDSTFYGKVYHYNPCTIGIDVKTGKWANKPARIAVRIDKDKDGTGIVEAYVATDDISKATSYVCFNFDKDVDFDKFQKMVLDNKEEYGAEAEVIQDIISRTTKFDYLIDKKLLKMDHGRFIFSPPTKEHLEALAKIDKTIVIPSEEAPKKEEPKVINMFEHMHSSAE